MKQVNLETIIHEARSYAETSTYRSNVYEIVKTVMKKFDCKTITKRIETAVSKALPDYQVFLSTGKSIVYLYVWGNGILYDNRLFMSLGYDQEKIFNYEKFCESNKGYEVKTEIENAIEALPEIVEEWNKLQEQVEALKKRIPSVYPIYKHF